MAQPYAIEPTGVRRYLLWSDIPNDVVCKSDGSIWFTELPTHVYRVDPADGRRPARRRFMCGSTSLYSLFVNTQGAPV